MARRNRGVRQPGFVSGQTEEELFMGITERPVVPGPLQIEAGTTRAVPKRPAAGVTAPLSPVRQAEQLNILRAGLPFAAAAAAPGAGEAAPGRAEEMKRLARVRPRAGVSPETIRAREAAAGARAAAPTRFEQKLALKGEAARIKAEADRIEAEEGRTFTREERIAVEEEARRTFKLEAGEAALDRKSREDMVTSRNETNIVVANIQNDPNATDEQRNAATVLSAALGNLDDLTERLGEAVDAGDQASILSIKASILNTRQLIDLARAQVFRPIAAPGATEAGAPTPTATIAGAAETPPTAVTGAGATPTEPVDLDQSGDISEIERREADDFNEAVAALERTDITAAQRTRLEAEIANYKKKVTAAVQGVAETKTPTGA